MAHSEILVAEESPGSGDATRAGPQALIVHGKNPAAGSGKPFYGVIGLPSAVCFQHVPQQPAVQTGCAGPLPKALFSDDLQANWSMAILNHPQRLGRSPRDIDDPTLRARSAVIDRHSN